MHAGATLGYSTSAGISQSLVHPSAPPASEAAAEAPGPPSSSSHGAPMVERGSQGSLAEPFSPPPYPPVDNSLLLRFSRLESSELFGVPSCAHLDLPLPVSAAPGPSQPHAQPGAAADVAQGNVAPAEVGGSAPSQSMQQGSLTLPDMLVPGGTDMQSSGTEASHALPAVTTARVGVAVSTAGAVVATPVTPAVPGGAANAATEGAATDGQEEGASAGAIALHWGAFRSPEPNATSHSSSGNKVGSGAGGGSQASSRAGGSSDMR